MRIRRPTEDPRPAQAAHFKKVLSYGQVDAHRAGAIDETFYRMPACSASGFRIAFISDIHHSDTPDFHRVFDAVNASLEARKPDYLLIGGDISGAAYELPKLPGMLKELGTGVPVRLAAPGNWEISKVWIHDWKKRVESAGIGWLDNSSFIDERVLVRGTGKIGAGYPELTDESGDRKLMKIVITHNPDELVYLDNGMAGLNRFDLALCGHFHGGQVRIPWFGALKIPSIYGRKFDYGLFSNSTMKLKMIVSSGLRGLTCKARFMCRREVVYIDVTGDAK
ncbi:MAG: metallophosphoesterase [Victivallaceae bacterium]|nr:metallophosphoesterase [Victivallaceae bacterium]